MRFAASVLELVTRVRQNVSNSRRHLHSVASREPGGPYGPLQVCPGPLERGGVASGHQLADVFLDAPRDGQLEILVQDGLQAGALTHGEPVAGAGEQLAVAPRGVDLAAAAAADLPGTAAPHGGDHLVREADHVPVIGG